MVPPGGPTGGTAHRALEEGEVADNAPRNDHIRRVDINGRINFAGARHYVGSGLARESVTVCLVDDEVRMHNRGQVLRSSQRRHPKEKEEVMI